MDARYKYLKSRLIDLFSAVPEGEKERSLRARSLTENGGISESSFLVHQNSNNNLAETSDTVIRRAVGEALADGSHGGRLVASWLAGKTVLKHIFCFYDPADAPQVSIHQTHAARVAEGGRCVWVMRNAEKAISLKDTEYGNEMIFHVIDGSPLEQEELLLREVYMPIFKRQRAWGVEGESTRGQLLKRCYAHHELLEKMLYAGAGNGRDAPSGLTTLAALPGDCSVRLPVNGNYAKVANDRPLLRKYEETAQRWLDQCRALLDEMPALSAQSSENLPEDEGPLAELQWWRDQQSKFASIAAQMSASSVLTVKALLTFANSDVIDTWNRIDASLTDAFNETKENAKYLASLEKYMEPLYSGPPSVIIQVLPSLMSHLQLMYTISHYYSGGTGDSDVVDENRQERMTRLFCLITNRIIATCKDTAKEGGRLWNQAESDEGLQNLVEKLEVCRRLRECYKNEYQTAQTNLAACPSGPQFDFAYRQIFGRIDLFCRRIDKLIEIFSTMQQYSLLRQYNIDDMDQVTERFDEIAELLKKNTRGADGIASDLLDYTRPSFDKEYNEFCNNVSELESSLQVFINSRFESITSTEAALELLQRFQRVLRQPHLRRDLETKYTLIFHNYGLDLENVQKVFEQNKANPPMVRNSTKLWFNAWLKSIDAAREGLNATLIVRHDGKLFVNFDSGILALIKETKAIAVLDGPRLPLPKAARHLLIQEHKFKSIYEELSFAIAEHGRVVDRILPLTQSILTGHLQDMEEQLKPGETILTWTSMNIQNYVSLAIAALLWPLFTTTYPPVEGAPVSPTAGAPEADRGEFKQVVDLTYMAAMSKPGGGKNDIPHRLKRHFAVLCVPLPTDSSLHQIYDTIYRERFVQ
eukprot:gene20848-32151_t